MISAWLSVSECQLSKHQGDSRGQYLVFIQLLRAVCKDNRSLSVRIWSAIWTLYTGHGPSHVTLRGCHHHVLHGCPPCPLSRIRLDLGSLSLRSLTQKLASAHTPPSPSPPLLSSVRWAHITGVTTLAPRLSCHCDTRGGGGGVLKNGQTNSWKHVLLSALCLPNSSTPSSQQQLMYSSPSPPTTTVEFKSRWVLKLFGYSLNYFLGKHWR